MTVSFGPRQLVLALDHAVSYARDDFLSGPSNAAALALTERWPDWPNRVMVLIGPEGAGKSHLAAIWAETAGARVLAANLLSEETLPTALATGALVLEDLEADGLDERALFHLLNLAREEGAFVLITARAHPASFRVTIRDLGSRLRALPSVGLSAPDDELHFQHFLSANCFGDHYTRTGIDVPTRELLTFAMLISLGGCEPQAKGHVAANLNVGNDRPALLSVATQLLPFIGYPRTLNAIRLIDEVVPASGKE